MSYQDMTVEIFDGATRSADDKRIGSFKVRVLASPEGEMFPGDAVTVEYDDKDLQAALGKLERREIDAAGLMALGRTLAALLLPIAAQSGTTSVRDFFAKSLVKLGPDTGLRLRLRLPPDLAVIPWEYAYVEHAGGAGMDGFLALDPRIAIVRHETLAAPVAEPVLGGDIKVVAALAEAEGLPELGLDDEMRFLNEALSGVAGVRIEPCRQATLQKLQPLLPGAGVFHFAGHGDFTRKMGAKPGTYTGTGFLAFGDERVDAEQMGINLRGQGVRLAVLAGCKTGRRDGISVWSGIAPALVKAEIPAVVANQYAITDKCAIAFSHQFYQALAGGLPIERAVSAGRIAAYNADKAGRDWGVPVLYLRAADGQLFSGAADPQTRERCRQAAEADVEVRAREVKASGVLAGAEVRRMIDGKLAVTVGVAGTVLGKVVGTDIECLQGGSTSARVDVGEVGPGGEVVGAKIGTFGFVGALERPRPTKAKPPPPPAPAPPTSGAEPDEALPKASASFSTNANVEVGSVTGGQVIGTQVNRREDNTESVALQSDDLFFEAIVRGYVENPRFVRRDWLAAAIDAKLAEPGKRFVLLTAAPGAGKSTFLAQLAHDHRDWLRYFIRRDQRSVFADVSDKSLLLRIGYQLAARHPELFAEDQGHLSVAVEQYFGTVAEHGEAVGVVVKRLLDSPFRQKVLTVVQHVQSNQGRVVGLQVDELVREPRMMKAADLSLLALIAPAQALQRTDTSQRIVILIDALDEIRYHPEAENILTWLTECPELPENIRFVLTSRPPDAAINLFRKKQAERVAELVISEDAVRQDIEQFLTNLVNEPALAQALTAQPGGKDLFVHKAATKARGNLGYLDALARGIDQAVERKDASTLDTLLSLDALPAELEGLYAFFLNQIKQEVAAQQIVGRDSSGKIYSLESWPAVYDPILGVLAVAAERVSAEIIAELGEIAVMLKWVYAALNRLRQFLEVIDGRYRLYHATVAEFLTAKKTHDDPETQDLYQDATRLHKQIVVHYGASRDHWLGVDWNKVDPYALLHLADHLSALQSDTGYRSRLYELVSCPVALAKWQRFGSLVSFGKDLSIAKEAAMQETPLNWADFMRCYLIEQTLSSCEISTDVVRFIAACVQKCGAPADTRKVIDRMLESASAIRASSEKACALSAIAAFLFQAGYMEDARDVVQRAFDETASIQSIQEKSETLSTIVLDIATIQGRERAKDAGRQALAIAQSTDFSWAKAIAVSAVAYALGKVGEEALAKEAFSQARSAAWDVKDNDDRAYALCAVAAAMERAGDGRAQYVFRDATSQLYGFGMPPEEIEDEYGAIYLDYRARSGRDLDSLFSMALEIKDRNQRQAALRSLAARLARAVLDGDYPPGSRGERNVDRLYDRATFLRLATEDAPTSASGEATLTLRALCEAIVEGAPRAPDGVPSKARGGTPLPLI